MDSCTHFAYKMGCWNSKKDSKNNEENEANIPLRNGDAQYSWSNRDRTDLSRFVIENVHGSIALRRQNEIGGQGIVIQNCNRATLILLDYSATVLIDDCIDCTMFVAPVVGSVAMRNCINCRIMSASQQFRTRDCNNIDCFIYCSTQPVIESSNQLRFASFSADFNDLDQLFSLANLDVFDNKWHQVYDFCADEQFEKHYAILNSDYKVDQLFDPLVTTLKNEQINFVLKSNVVPFTVGVTQIEMLRMMDGHIADLFLLFIGFSDTKNDQINIIQKLLAKFHNFPHDRLIPLLSRSFEGSSRSFKRLKQLFDGTEIQKIVAILYKHSGHNFDTTDNHSAFLPEDIREINLETIRIKPFDFIDGSKEFSEFLTMFDYK